MLAAWRGYDLAGSVFLRNCEDMNIAGITVSNSGGFAIFEEFGEGRNHYQNCRILRAPAPSGANPSEPPLFASACDGFHSTAVRHGPLYENCYVEYTDDDGFAIHGFGSLVMESSDQAITVGRMGGSYDECPYQIGDVLRFYDTTGALVDDAKVISLNPRPGYICKQALSSDFRVLSRLAANNRLFYDDVRLDHPVAAKFSWLTVDANSLGSGYVIRNCKVYHNRERGMLIKASDGLIENCIVDGSTKGGIAFMPELGYWDEADFVRNTTIRGNIIRNVGSGRSTMGALNISEWRAAGPVPIPGGHRDILIENNTFDQNDGVNILLTSTENLTFRHNHFIQPMQYDHPTDWVPNSADSLFWITECRQIVLDGNQIENPGPFMKKVVETSGKTDSISEDY